MENQNSPRTSILDLIKAAFWPALVLVIFIDFHDVLKRTLELLPREIEKASKIQYGPLLVEIREQAGKSPFPDLSEILGTLTGDEISLLLQVFSINTRLAGSYESQSEFYVPSDEVMLSFRNLEKSNLIRFSMRGGIGLSVDRLRSDIASMKPFRKDEATGDPLRSMYFKYDKDDSTAKEIMEAEYKLTDKGRDAVKAIVKAVSLSISPAQ